jgi:hypothetical protein
MATEVSDLTRVADLNFGAPDLVHRHMTPIPSAHRTANHRSESLTCCHTLSPYATTGPSMMVVEEAPVPAPKPGLLSLGAAGGGGKFKDPRTTTSPSEASAQAHHATAIKEGA